MELKDKEKKRRKKKRDKEEDDNKESTSIDQEGEKIGFLSLESSEKSTTAGDIEHYQSEECDGSVIGNKKRKGEVSIDSGTDKKKRKKNEQKDGASDRVKPSSGKAKKATTKDKVRKETQGPTSPMKKKVASQPEEKSKLKRVSFSGDIEVFPPKVNSDGEEEEYDEDNLVRGKRFTEAEDQLIKDSVYNYINTNQLGEKGLEMVLNCRKYKEVRGCWKEISATIPYRPLVAVYCRGRSLFERSEERGFTEEENEIIRKFHAEYGSDWKKLSGILGKQRIHIKDAWRRIRLPNRKKGRWSQDEYQSLFDLVNLNLRMKAFEEKKSTNNMIREGISWEAISDKISTRTMSGCCHKWYDQLTSPLVQQGLWADTDDYLLLDALQEQEACTVEDVDWDNLVDGRPGEVCERRWVEMVRHIGGYRERPFIEQLDVLSKRYCGDMLEYRFKQHEKEEEGTEREKEKGKKKGNVFYSYNCV
ncbi:uncharacterized protein A4U43_C04F3280 [Asparagus officinalis]|uniref:Myb-like domain-containing protein n=1 Tax=Asparagus officinalis TaxID=4686 RepID=A0A5P1F3D4_ASPOF|nr:cyclin-D-binding Myb-like transcription factor 1 [Asparagus officinalis]ONK70960.1 uncharacterized protein A4U43_C04F3280 [Asparagus officinalis]